MLTLAFPADALTEKFTCAATAARDLHQKITARRVSPPEKILALFPELRAA